MAALTGFAYAGEYDPSTRYPGRVYFVPATQWLALSGSPVGIAGEHDLFGGVVPYPFVATKVITHPLEQPKALAPKGWSDTFPQPGAKRGAGGQFGLYQSKPMLPVNVFWSAGLSAQAGSRDRRRGQKVIRSLTELAEALAAIDTAELADAGLVLEENLTAVTTYSVGQVRVADLQPRITAASD